MASSNRSALITKSHKVLKKHFQPIAPPEGRSLLEHLLLACCLENSTHENAEQAYSVLTNQFFDWNEVRVSARRELAEAMTTLADPGDAAMRLRGSLQSVFEAFYSFDLEAMKKQNIGQAAKTLGKYDGTTPFTVAYVTQAALSGHSIPLNRGAFTVLVVIGVISQAEADRHVAPGLERAISKSKGIEYASLLHQLGVQLSMNPYSPAVRQILLEIAPDCKDRLPKRTAKKPDKKPSKTDAGAKKNTAGAKKDTADAKKSAAGTKQPTKKAKVASAKVTTKKPAAAKKKPTKKKTTPVKKTEAKKKATGTDAAKKKSAAKKKTSTKRSAKPKPR